MKGSPEDFLLGRTSAKTFGPFSSEPTESYPLWMITVCALLAFGYELYITLMHWKQLPHKGVFAAALCAVVAQWVGQCKILLELRKLASGEDAQLALNKATSYLVATAVLVFVSTGAILSTLLVILR